MFAKPTHELRSTQAGQLNVGVCFHDHHAASVYPFDAAVMDSQNPLVVNKKLLALIVPYGNEVTHSACSGGAMPLHERTKAATIHRLHQPAPKPLPPAKVKNQSHPACSGNIHTMHIEGTSKPIHSHEAAPQPTSTADIAHIDASSRFLRGSLPENFHEAGKGFVAALNPPNLIQHRLKTTLDVQF